MKELDIHPTVKLGESKFDLKNISIGENTYLQSATVYSGERAWVKIGRYCAIGFNVSIKARTHDLKGSTANERRERNIRKEADIIIADYVWIGDNVYIREGITIGNNAVIGANSVVTKDVSPFTVVGGVPAKKIKDIPR